MSPEMQENKRAIEEKCCWTRECLLFDYCSNLIFNFEKFGDDVSWYGFIWVYHIVVHPTFWIYISIYFTKLGRFKPLHLWVFFSSSSNAQMAQMLNLSLYSSTILWDNDNSFNFFSSVLFRFGSLIFIPLSSSLLILLFMPSILLLSPSAEIFFSTYYIFLF